MQELCIEAFYQKIEKQNMEDRMHEVILENPITGRKGIRYNLDFLTFPSTTAPICGMIGYHLWKGLKEHDGCDE